MASPYSAIATYFAPASYTTPDYTYEASFGSDTGNGDNLVVMLGFTAPADIDNMASATVTDSQGNVYSLQDYASDVDDYNGLAVFVCYGALPCETSDKLYVLLGAESADYFNVHCIGISDSGNIDVDVQNTQPSGTSVSIATGTFAYEPETVLQFSICSVSPTLTGGLTSLGGVVQDSTGPYTEVAYKNITSTASLTPGISWTSNHAGALIVISFIPSLPSFNNELPLSDGVTGMAYSQTLEATGGESPYTYAVQAGSSLPAGLTLTSGVVSGTPSAAGTYTFTLVVTDAASNSTASSYTVNILAGGSSGALAVTAPGNILNDTDAYFEKTSGGTWHADINADTANITTVVSLAGTKSLSWITPADGPSSIKTGTYSVAPYKGYALGGFMLPPGARDCYAGLYFLDSSSDVIGSLTLSQANQTSQIGWAPVAGLFTTPADCAFVQVVAYVDDGNAGDTIVIDQWSLVQSHAAVFVDWCNSPFNLNPAAGMAAGDSFMDCTPWCRLDQNINLNRGRQDAISETNAGSATLYLQNDQGMFTRESGNSFIPFLQNGDGDCTLQRRLMISETDNSGVWYTRMDGPVSEIDLNYDNPGFTGLATVMSSDVLAMLNRTDSLYCWTKSQVMADGPAFHWTLDDTGDAGSAGVAAESSGNAGPPLHLVQSDGSNEATVVWADTSAGVETLADSSYVGKLDGSEYWAPGQVVPNSQIRGLDSGFVGPWSTPLQSVQFTPVLTSGTANNYLGNPGYYLSAFLGANAISPNATGSDYTVEGWFMMSPDVQTSLSKLVGPYTVVSLGNTRNKYCLNAGINPASAGSTFKAQYWNQPPAWLNLNWPSAANPADLEHCSNSLALDNGLPHHVVIVINGDPSAPQVIVYLDSQEVGQFTMSTGQTFDTICIGGAYGGQACFYGNLSCFSVYDYAFSINQVTNHCMMGQYGVWEQPTDNAITAIGQFAGLPSYWNNLQANNHGLTLAEYQDITGESALTSMQLFEQAEAGLLYVNASGQLTFHPRDYRMGKGAPDLVLPSDLYDNTGGMTLIDQYQNNEAAVSSQLYSVGASAIDATSQAKYGPYATISSSQSPTQLPLLTWGRSMALLGLPTLTYSPDPNLTDLANWQARSKSGPYLLPPTLNIDTLTLDESLGVTLADLLAVDVDYVIGMASDVPDNFPTDPLQREWFVEGVNETIGQQQSNIQFYLSPTSGQRAWVPGDSTYGVLGSTTRVGISAPDLSTPEADGKDVSHDAGGPFWAPTFSDTMNSPRGGQGFVGANDIRGLTSNLKKVLQPPMCVVAAQNEALSYADGSLSSPQMYWDEIYIDTEGGMGLVPGWVNWYCVSVPGWYEIDCALPWAWNVSGQAGYCGEAWIVVAQNGAQTVADGVGTPITNGAYVCPVGETTRWTNNTTGNAVCAPSARMYLGAGDMVTLAASQDYTAAHSTGTSSGGCMMSLIWTGFGTSDDRAQVNSAITGGTVSNPAKTTLATVTYTCTQTYRYNGFSFYKNNFSKRLGIGGPFNVGYWNSTADSQFAIADFNHAQIVSDLDGKTLVAAQLTIEQTALKSGSGNSVLPLGVITNNVGVKNITYAQYQADVHDTMTLLNFKDSDQGSPKTFTIPTSIMKAFTTGFNSGAAHAHGLIFGENFDQKPPSKSGAPKTAGTTPATYDGGPASVTLTVTYLG